MALLDDGKVARFGDREVTGDAIKRYVPKEFFPLDDEDDLIAKLPPFQDGEFTGLLLETMPYARSARQVLTSGLESPPPESP